VTPFEAVDFVFDAEFLALQIGDGIHVGQWPVDFSVDFLFEIGVPGTERFDTIQQRHQGSS
jgi:hypothetical protein